MWHRERTILLSIIFTYEGDLLLEKVPVDLKLLFEHDLSPVLYDQSARVHVLRRPQSLPVLLHPRNTAQLELKQIHIAFHNHTRVGLWKTPATYHTVSIPLTGPSIKLWIIASNG